MDISQRRRDKPPPLKGHKSHFKTRVRLWNKLIVQLLLCALCLLFGTTKIMTFSVGKVNNSILFGSTVERRQFFFFLSGGGVKSRLGARENYDHRKRFTAPVSF